MGETKYCNEVGGAPKELEADILRVQHLVEWADGIKGAPEIIENQYQVLKHSNPKKVKMTPKLEIYYVEGAKFRSEVVPEWQRCLHSPERNGFRLI